ncbi:MAG: LPS export ABC transporter periplasmic protein LptC [Melioribacteraceae bacterium]
MKIKYKTVLLFIVLICESILLLSCTEPKLKPKVDNSVSSEELPDQESRNAKITFTEEGKLKAYLFADVIKVNSEKREKHLEVVKINFFDEDEKQSTTLTSEIGRIDDRTQDMYAIGDVVAVSDSGITLTTDELVWNNKTQKITTDKYVKIKSDKEIIEGYGFESDQNLQNYTIFNITYITSLEE